MAIRRVYVCALLLALGLLPALQAQRVIVLPGAGATGSQATAFIPEPLAIAGTINAAPGAFLAFADPSGSRFYIVTTAAVAIVDASGAQTQNLLDIAGPVTGAALSPDGRRLVVVAGNASSGSVYAFDVSATTVNPVAAILVGNNPFGVAIGSDSRRAFVLTSAGLTPIDLTAGTAGAAAAISGLFVQGSAQPGITMGPNGLLYVNAAAALYEINPADLSVVATMAVGGYPGEPAFSPDGTLIATPNQVAGNPVATVFNLTTHAVSATLSPQGVTVRFTQLFFGGSPLMIYGIGTNRILYDFSPTAAGLGAPTFGTASVIGGVLGGAVSTETVPKYLFLATNNGVLRADLAAQTLMSAAMTTPGGPVFYTVPEGTGRAASVRAFNTAQALATGAASLPMVIQVFNSAGQPLAGQAVAWSAGNLTLQSSMTTTNSLGQAVATALAPATAGTFAIAATVGTTTLNASFTLQVGTVAPPPPGGGVGGPGLSIVSGNGQARGSSNSTIEPLVVQVLTNAGAPAPNVAVKFELGGSGGVLLPNRADTGQNTCVMSYGTATCTTDAKGHASVFLQTPSLEDFQDSWLTSTVKASAAATSSTPAGQVTFNVVTYPFRLYATSQLGPPPLVSQLAPPLGTIALNGQQGQTIKGAFKVMMNAQSGWRTSSPVPNIGLTVRGTAAYSIDGYGPISCSGGTVLSDATGTATCDLVISGNTSPGTHTIYRVVGAYDLKALVVTVTAPPRVPTTITPAAGTDGQVVTVGQKLPKRLSATVKDQSGTPMANQTVTWSVVSGQATLANQSSKTSANGVASADATPTTAGTVLVKLAAGAASFTYTITANTALTAVTALSGFGQTAVTSAPFTSPLTAQINPVTAGVPVTFAVTSGDATLVGGPTVNTNDLGQASISVNAGATAGSVTVTATVAGLPPATFNLTVRTPGPDLTKLIVLNGASFQPEFAYGSLVSIFAPGLTAGLSIETGTCLSGGGIGPAPTRLAGVEFLFGDRPAPIFAICNNTDGSEQANVQVPFELGVPVSDLFITIRYFADTASPTSFSKGGVTVLSVAPAIFEWVANSQKIAVAQRPDGSIVSPDNPAHAGETIRVYATGLGWTMPAPRTDQPGIPDQVTYNQAVATLNGQGVGAVNATYAENMIGLYIVEFQIPSGQTGTGVPLIIGVVENGQQHNSQESQIPISQ